MCSVYHTHSSLLWNFICLTFFPLPLKIPAEWVTLIESKCDPTVTGEEDFYIMKGLSISAMVVIFHHRQGQFIPTAL